MCTVTRPGIASLASSIAVELLVSILQHSLGNEAPAAGNDNGVNDDDETLGGVPHQIRGFLRTFSNLKFSGPAYQNCSACSKNIVSAYKYDAWELVKRACNEKGYVERLSGLEEVQRAALSSIEGLDWDNEEDEDSITSEIA
jgi:ubiquitin-like modifier-activating enzyme ATG7